MRFNFRGILQNFQRVFRAATSQSVRVVIYGTHSTSWMTTLGPEGEVWKRLPQVVEVLMLEGTEAALPESKIQGLRTVVIPLMERHAIACPDSFPTLAANQHSVEILGNKAKFARYASDHGLGDLCPKVFPSKEAVQFPCVVKRTDLNAGTGIKYAGSEIELAQILEQELWKGKEWILQSYVPSSIEYVAHCTCNKGRIFWNCAYEYDLGRIQIRDMALPTKRIPLPQEHLNTFERFLLPLSFSGPCNIDYRMREDGTLAVLEINPRLGGSLMRPENIEDLRGALASIIEGALGLCLEDNH